MSWSEWADSTDSHNRAWRTSVSGLTWTDLAISGLIAEHEVGLVVVGQPLTLRGEIGPQARRVERAAQALAESLSVPVRMWDERYSTTAAEEILGQVRRRGKRRGRDQTEVDAVAAAVILQAFLDSQAADRDVEET